MAYDEVLAERVRDQLVEKSITEKRMFGGWAVMWRGNLLAGVIGDDLVARVRPAAMSEALALRGARPFDFAGRPMKGWLYVAQGALEDDSDLCMWIERCLSFVGTLPPK